MLKKMSKNTSTFIWQTLFPIQNRIILNKMISIRKKKNVKKKKKKSRVTQSFIFSRLDGLICLYVFDTNKLNSVLLLINLTFCGSAHQ